jgi:hypothetical protein
MFIIEARLRDEGGKATLITGLEMNEINDYKPRSLYLFMSSSHDKAKTRAIDFCKK